MKMKGTELPQRKNHRRKRIVKRIYAFDVFNIAIMTLFCCTILYPFLYLIKQSISAGGFNVSLSLIPDSISFASYRKVFANRYIGLGYMNTIVRTVLGTPLTVIVTILAAYPLSKKHLPNRWFWTGIFVFTMFFDGGLIPTFLVVKGVGIYDSFLALILPRLMDTFTLLIVRNFFMSIPNEIEESANMDGAHDLTILFRIIVPISMPIIATVILWTVVNHWNWWFDSLIYIKTPEKMALQTVLRRIIIEGTAQMIDQSGFNEEGALNPDNLKAAAVIVTITPIICVYPFLQKYFVKGIMVGSLKG